MLVFLYFNITYLLFIINLIPIYLQLFYVFKYKMIDYKNIFIAFCSGLACKLYDDLQDNYLLEKFKNITFMEYLKGIHYILITTLSLENPLFFIFFYLGNFFNYLSNPIAFYEPYEHSLIYSFLLLVMLLDFTKITNIYFFDYILVGLLFLINFLEPFFEKFLHKNKLNNISDQKDLIEPLFNNEFSYSKLYTRIFFLFVSLLYCYLSQSATTFYIYCYFTGYFLISVLVQCYSLFTIKNSQDSNSQDSNSHNSNSQDSNSHDSNSHDSNSHDSKDIPI